MKTLNIIRHTIFFFSYPASFNLKIFIYNFILRLDLLKFELLIFIYFKFTSLLLKIRVFILLLIIIINLVCLLIHCINEIQFFNFYIISFFNLVSNFVNFQFDDSFIYSNPNNINGDSSHHDFNLNNSNSSNNINPSNNPNPNPGGPQINGVSLVNGIVNGTHDSYSDSDSDLSYNFNDGNVNESTSLELNNQGNNEVLQPSSNFRFDSPAPIFNEIEFDPQFDDFVFNNHVLYPYGHQFFIDMVRRHINADSIDSIISIINNINTTDNTYWDPNTVNAAIIQINEIINQ